MAKPDFAAYIKVIFQNHLPIKGNQYNYSSVGHFARQNFLKEIIKYTEAAYEQGLKRGRDEKIKFPSEEELFSWAHDFGSRNYFTNSLKEIYSWLKSRFEEMNK